MSKDRPKGQTQDEPTALARIEPVAYFDIGYDGYIDLGSDLTDEEARQKLGAGKHLLYSAAATVERLVQERDDFEQARDYFEKMNVMHFDQLLACQQERDELTVFQGMFNDMLLVEVELRKQLAAMTQERDSAKTLAIFYSELAAASQAREQQLREALKYLEGNELDSDNCASIEVASKRVARIARDALALPQDNTALKAWGVKLLRKMADEFEKAFAEGALNPWIRLRRKADELEGKK
jgi:hypothetical protein